MPDVVFAQIVRTELLLKDGESCIQLDLQPVNSDSRLLYCEVEVEMQPFAAFMASMDIERLSEMKGNLVRLRLEDVNPRQIAGAKDEWINVHC